MLRKLLTVAVLVAALWTVLAGPAEAQVTTTTTTAVSWSPVTDAGRSTACAWEWGGVPEAVPQRCDDVGEVTLPVWLLVGVGLGIFLGAAALVGSWRK